MNRKKLFMFVCSVSLMGLVTKAAFAEPQVNEPSPGVYELADWVEYDWLVGCTPTAVSMMIGYWDRNGYGGLMHGNTTKYGYPVAQAIYSDGFVKDYGSPTSTDEYFRDPYGIIRDNSEGDIIHKDNSIADYVLTGQSRINLDYGWSKLYGVSIGIHGWANYRGYGGFQATDYRSVDFSFDRLATEIKSGRPVMASVASSNSGTTDHSIVIVAVNENTRQYGFLAGWLDDETLEGEGVRWASYRHADYGRQWGVHTLVTVMPPEQDQLQGADTLLVQNNGSGSKHVIGGRTNRQGALTETFSATNILNSKTLAIASGDGHEFYQIINDGLGSARLLQLRSFGSGKFSWSVRNSNVGLNRERTRGLATADNKTFWQLYDDSSGTLALNKLQLNAAKDNFVSPQRISDDTGLSRTSTLGAAMRDPNELLVYVKNSSGGIDLYTLNPATASNLQLVSRNIAGVSNMAAIAAWNPPETAEDDGDGATIQVDTTELILNNSFSGNLAAKQWKFFKYFAPSDQPVISFLLDGLSADLDLYVRAGDVPTGDVNDGTFDCGSWRGDTLSDTCKLDDAAGKTWYVGVHAYKAGDFTLTALTPAGEGGGLENTISFDSAELGDVRQGEWQWYRYDADESQKASFSITDLVNDADLYIREGARPTGSIEQDGVYDCASTNGDKHNDVCTLDVTAGQSYYIGIYGYRATSYNLILKRAVAATNVRRLTVGDSDSSSLAQDEWAWYRLTPPGGTGHIEFALTGLDDDVDLYVRRGEAPSGTVNNSGNYDCGSWKGGRNDELCSVSASTPGGDWFVGLFAYRASAYTLSATAATTRQKQQLTRDVVDKIDDKLSKSRMAIIRRNLANSDLGGLSISDSDSNDSGAGRQVEDESTADSSSENDTDKSGGGGGVFAYAFLCILLGFGLRRKIS